MQISGPSRLPKSLHFVVGEHSLSVVIGLCVLSNIDS